MTASRAGALTLYGPAERVLPGCGWHAILLGHRAVTDDAGPPHQPRTRVHTHVADVVKTSLRVIWTKDPNPTDRSRRNICSCAQPSAGRSLESETSHASRRPPAHGWHPAHRGGSGTERRVHSPADDPLPDTGLLRDQHPGPHRPPGPGGTGAV